MLEFKILCAMCRSSISKSQSNSTNDYQCALYTCTHIHTYMSSIFLLKYKDVFISKYEIWGMLKETRGAFWNKSIVLQSKRRQSINQFKQSSNDCLEVNLSAYNLWLNTNCFSIHLIQNQRMTNCAECKILFS